MGECGTGLSALFNSTKLFGVESSGL